MAMKHCPGPRLLRWPILVSILVVAGATPGCKKDKPATAPAVQKKAEPAKQAVEDKTEQNAKVDDKKATTADKIGVPECDAYLEKYSACIEAKAPAASRAMMRKHIEETRQTWQRAAAAPEGKRELLPACKTAYEAAAKAMTSLGCKW
jgi:hypothetical protein